MPRTRERSEWSGHGVDGQTAPAKTATQPAGANNKEPHRKHSADPKHPRSEERSHRGRYGTLPVGMGSAARSRREGKAFPCKLAVRTVKPRVNSAVGLLVIVMDSAEPRAFNC